MRGKKMQDPHASAKGKWQLPILQSQPFVVATVVAQKLKAAKKPLSSLFPSLESTPPRLFHLVS
jgi:hypothetical protein